MTLVKRVNGFAPIGDYAAIGDGHSMALVATDGAIDWLCVPALDSPSVFGAILDPAGGGSFTVAPAEGFEVERRYLERTNVLETTFRCSGGTVRVTDALCRPTGESPPGRELVRQIEGMDGEVALHWRVEPRFDYGRQPAQIEPWADAHIFTDGRSGVRLALQAWQAGEALVSHGAVEGAFSVGAGDCAVLRLAAVEGEPLLLSRREAVQRRLAETAEYWRRWIARSRYDGPWEEAVSRSLLAIGLLVDSRHGAIAAAGTTSLPEALGRPFNYDYRFAWTRDLSFTLDALLRAGFDELAQGSFGWLLSATERTHPRIDPVYRLDGTVLRSQSQLDLPGYRNTSPVHVGNQAGAQLQLGGFGDFLETAWMFTRHGGVLGRSAGERIGDIANLLTHIWHRQDAGLWELGQYGHYTTSKVGVWTTFDRALRLAQDGQVPSRHLARWQAAREEVREYIERELWSPARRSYVQKQGSESLDAGTLLNARRGYQDPRGERMNSTIDAIRSELSAGGPLLYRFSGMQDKENAFLACSFWCVEALAAAGRLDEASEMMDSLTGLSNDVGLLSEEMDPSSRALRGNLPQALSHLALIIAAVMFEQHGSDSGERQVEAALR